ncbi:hypothetical protein CONPUDRAFT_82816 [Coniophora puteana RWD-64-598 SS2]|uniref:Mitochondrial carrier n=1 Tax=Coniophora puteana (strain RWD-64-598) TaxID=741705 RepID=A0A5M3MNN7_CONPW|nr:uncharacterized protein CONPUDRAFT_82816 [Coniophora puteana RWD-64-598 SS2]EIW80723.1 hypothetical protein CONPUDRAFT_82816 [Coniophora puteana RWD-64-598 SS2]
MSNFAVFVLFRTVPLLIAIVAVPFQGALVRFRASYNPRCITLGSEEGAAPQAETVFVGYFKVLRRVYKLEGIPGLYKGLMPSLIYAAFYMISSVLPWSFALAYCISNGAHKSPCSLIFHNPLVLQTISHLLSFVVKLPELIILDRSITTPKKLSYFGVSGSLRILLTSTERQRPWGMYLTPGVFAGLAIRWVYNFVAPRAILMFLGNFLWHRGMGIVALFNITVVLNAFLSAIVMTPIDVILVRLSIQRNHTLPEVNSGAQDDGSSVERAGERYSDEDVVDLRTDREAYTGLLDCGKRIIKEEGWPVLYRAWWATSLSGLISR